MTLIDILARDLPSKGGWPKGIEKVNQSILDGEIYMYKPCEILTGRGILFMDIAENPRDFVFRGEYEEALKYTKDDKRNIAITKLAKIIRGPGGPYAEVKAAQIYDAIKSGDIVIE